MNNMKIAIDGPGGAGKSTIAKAAAKALGLIYIDTGAMYRAVALYAIRKGVNTETEAVDALLPEVEITIQHEGDTQRIYLCGEDVSDQIRTPEISVGASKVAVRPAVRLKLVELQRALAKTNNVIMDGRDIGTYVLPDADLKIFLVADEQERARRRYKELLEKGEKCSFDEVLLDLQFRDKNDASRAFAPLKQAEDAVLLDSTTLSLAETVERVITMIKGKM
ncbi:MAG: (d)CMP kinase [Clostridia bacterium]|nr:(d)CMP kinase [Clostridia bacterium]